MAENVETFGNVWGGSGKIGRLFFIKTSGHSGAKFEQSVIQFFPKTLKFSPSNFIPVETAKILAANLNETFAKYFAEADIDNGIDYRNETPPTSAPTY